MSFGNRLLELRKKYSLTQEKLSEKLEVSRQTISKWESDLSFPETEKLIKLGELFSVTVDYLLTGKMDNEDLKIINLDNYTIDDYSEYEGDLCNIEVKDWNHGYYDIIVLKDYNDYLLFYYKHKKSILKFGIVLKEHIDKIIRFEDSGSVQRYNYEIELENNFSGDPFELLLNHLCSIQINTKNMSEFLFSTDGYQKVILTKVDVNSIEIKDENTQVKIDKKNIVGIIEY